jgi:hypothetical protein
MFIELGKVRNPIRRGCLEKILHRVWNIGKKIV